MKTKIFFAIALHSYKENISAKISCLRKVLSIYISLLSKEGHKHRQTKNQISKSQDYANA